MTLLQSAAITYRERRREEKQHFLREDENERDCLLAKGHMRNVSKLLGKGGGVSEHRVCMCEMVGKGQVRVEDQDLLKEESHHCPPLGHFWSSRQPQDQ